MPKKGKDRRSDRDDARGQDRPGGLGGDEDYDWIRYLGEGRASSAPSAQPAARPATLPRRPGEDSGQDRDGGTRRAGGGGIGSGGARGSAQPAEPVPAAGSAVAGSAVAGRRGRSARPDRAAGQGRSEGAGRAEPPDRAAGYRPEPRSLPADGGPSRPPTGRTVRLTAGQAVDLHAGAAEDSLFNPAANDYGQPLYPAGADSLRGQQVRPPGRATPGQDRPEQSRPGRGRAEPGWLREGWPGQDRSEPSMNTAEYAQPLYPSQDASTGIAVRPRRSGPDDDPLADTDARRQHVDGDGRLASRPGRFNPPAAARAITDSGQRTGTDQRDRPPADGASPEIQLLDRQLRYRGKPPRKPRQSGRQKPRKQGAPGKGRPQGRRRTARKALILGGSAIVAVLAVAAYLVLRPQPSHAVSAPTTLGSYARQQANATAEALKRRILAAAGGDVKNVVAAVYERTTGPGTSTGPQIIVFIGGNLTGNASASSLISAFMTRLHGAFTTSAGQLGGQAACAPGSNGGPAECAWADNDTFGVVVSATLTAAGLANEMRQMRSQVEHVVT